MIRSLRLFYIRLNLYGEPVSNRKERLRDKYKTMRIVFTYLLLFLVYGCGSKEPVFPPEPRIEFVSAEPDTVKEPLDFTNPTKENKLFLTIRYEDGDGDLGSPNKEDLNFVIFDRRGLGKIPFDTLKYSLPDLTPQALNQSIQGTIRVEIAFLLRRSGQMAEDTAFFEMYIIDRAGNRSNSVESGPVYILAP